MSDEPKLFASNEVWPVCYVHGTRMDAYDGAPAGRWVCLDCCVWDRGKHIAQLEARAKELEGLVRELVAVGSGDEAGCGAYAYPNCACPICRGKAALDRGTR